VSILFTVPAMMTLLAQSVSVQRSGESVVVHAPGFVFLRGEPLARVKDGRAIRVDLELAVLPGPGGVPTTQTRQVFVLSYDLWEERFAVTLPGTPPRSTTHRTPASAEGWCLEQLAVPVRALGALGRDRPFWVRLEYRILDGEGAPADDEGAFTLKGLIDALSRRRKETVWTHAMEAGPFRLGT
jgi:hypothetical protein